MLSKISCRNFRALREVDVPLSPLTAIVGANGSGKTSFLRAINLLLGNFWPSLRSIRVPEDFTNFATSEPLRIVASFDEPLERVDQLGPHRDVFGLRLTCAEYKRKTKKGDVGDLHLDFVPLGPEGKDLYAASTPPRKGERPDFRPVTTVSSGIRDQARILFIDHRRSVTQHLPTMRGSILGQLFQPALKEFERAAGAPGREEFSARYQHAMDALRTPRVLEVEEVVAETTKKMLGFLGSATTRRLSIGFGFADPANPFSSLRLIYTEEGREIPGAELGLGVQSALVIGIFEALRQLGDPVGCLVVEEPEMYLHPQAQRYFFRLLEEIADEGDCQVVYSTHSPIFADVGHFEAIRLFRREAKSFTECAYVAEPEDIAYLTARREAQKIAIAFDASRNEMLFARKALLVEGPGDRLAARIAAERVGLDLDAEDLAVVDCGSKAAIPFVARTARALGVPFVVLHDSDIYEEVGAPEEVEKIRTDNAKQASFNADIVGAAGETRAVFVCEPSLEAILGIGRNAPDKPRRVVEALEPLDATSIPGPLIDAVKGLGA